MSWNNSYDLTPLHLASLSIDWQWQFNHSPWAQPNHIILQNLDTFTSEEVRKRRKRRTLSLIESHVSNCRPRLYRSCHERTQPAQTRDFILASHYEKGGTNKWKNILEPLRACLECNHHSVLTCTNSSLHGLRFHTSCVRVLQGRKQRRSTTAARQQAFHSWK